MSDKLLLLHSRYSVDDCDIWRAAIKRGWRTERIGMSHIELGYKLAGHPNMVRYYGNMLHIEEIGKYLPCKMLPLDIANLANLEPWTKRKIELFRCKDIAMPLREAGFYKATGIKWLESRVYKAGESFECKPDDTIYKQDILDIVSEVRTFVINGEIQTASWYKVEREFDPKPVQTFGPLDELQALTDSLWSEAKWPNGVVFDFGCLKSGEWIFIEANEAYASGLYYCDPDKCLDTIVASQVS